MVSAFAGCAKTSTLALAAPRVRVPALALAFNRKIAKELDGKLPGNFSCKTLNGLGYGAWARALPAVAKFTIDDRKLGKLVSSVAKDRKVSLPGQQWDDIRRLVSRAMQAGITPGDQGTPLTADTPAEWRELAEDLWITSEDFDFVFDLAHEVLEHSITLARAGTISFDDQVYCPVVLGGRWPQFPVVFVDEAQDLSPLNHAMLARALRQDGKLVAVGDPKQAIYGFRGADTQSMQTMRRLRASWRDLPLATTFRCPKVIVARQQHHAQGFTAWPTNAEGRVASLAQGEAQTWTWVDVMALAQVPGTHVPSIAVLCRNNAPLLALGFKLLRQGVGIVMLGRDIGKGLVALSRKIAPDDSTPADTFAGLLTEWLDHELGLAAANDQPERVSGLHDRAECLRAVLGQGVRDAGELRRALDRLFAREDGLVSLATGHKAKGLEWDLVLHLDPWRIPSRHAREAAQTGDRRQLEQEMNLRYVIETRTRHTLVNADLEAFAGDQG